MPNTYIPEQIEQAKEWLESGDEYDKDYATCILAALEAAEQERDEFIQSEKEYAKILITAAGEKETESITLAVLRVKERIIALAAYAAKLEKAGDKIRNYKPDSNQLQAETDIEELFDDWDAARKEKP